MDHYASHSHVVIGSLDLNHTQGVLKRKSIHVGVFKFVVCLIGKTLGDLGRPCVETSNEGNKYIFVMNTSFPIWKTWDAGNGLWKPGKWRIF